MQQADIHLFLSDFFQENRCSIQPLSSTAFEVQLSNEIDKEIMNRPFYWHYIEKMNGQPSPFKLKIETDSSKMNDDKKTEFIHYGSPRLRQLFSLAIQKGKFGRFYEQVQPELQSVPLKPWLCLNGFINYHSHLKKNRFFSIGLSLITGEMLNDFHDLVQNWKIDSQLPHYTFTLSPLVKESSGIERIQHYLVSSVEKETHHWADEAITKMNVDLKLLEQFYTSETSSNETYEKEKQTISEQFQPYVTLSIENGAMFYLNSHPVNYPPLKF
ncbi:YqhG family protein [Salipaludibacillus neizhouensis]|nr:YqhG family protein [Salipaludibacillus neizhouensis]